MPESAKRTVFISHAGPDSAYALMIAGGLEKCGIHARVDQVEVKAGTNIVMWMNAAVAESDYVLLLLSPSSLGRYWVEMEWSSALMKEADLRRTFVITCVLPGLEDDAIPALLRNRAYIDFRTDQEAPLLQLISRLKDDELIRRDLGRYPVPAPASMQGRVSKAYAGSPSDLEVVVHSNRFGRSFKLCAPESATPSYLMGMLRDELNLKFSNVDPAIGVELSYTYYLKHNGEAITLNTTLRDAGVRSGDRLELWIRVTLRDLIEDKDVGEKVLHDLYMITFDHAGPILKARNKAFSSAEIANIASKFFAHVDK